jgi:hypothetical protein
MIKASDGIQWHPIARVDKYDTASVDYAARKSGLAVPRSHEMQAFTTPFESIEIEGNALTTVGLNRLTAVMIGANTGTMDSTRVRLGVGDNATAFALGDTALSTGANAYYRVMDATYPTQANGVMTFAASFATGEANFAWACWGLDLGTATVTSSGTVNAVLVNRKVAALGTKASGTWVLTVSVTFS